MLDKKLKEANRQIDRDRENYSKRLLELETQKKYLIYIGLPALSFMFIINTVLLIMLF